MQQVASKLRPNNGIQSQAQAIVITAITLFAISGLLVGFAVGAFVRPQNQTPTAKKSGPAVITKPTATPTPPPTPQPIVLGCPKIVQFNPAEVINNDIPYTLTVQALDESAGKCNIAANNPIHQPDITCKLWLVQRIPDGQFFQFSNSNDQLKHPDMLRSPLAGTVQNKPFPEIPGLLFDPTTEQTQACNDQGQGSWKYTISPTIPAGAYSLLVLTDWKGVHFNWSWGNIDITNKAN